MVRIDTPNDYHYIYLNDHGVDIQGHNNISFRVRAGNDAHIALSLDKNNWDTHTYEIVIGGWKNSRSVIRRCDQCLPKSNFVHSPLNASEFKPFWISWTNGDIRVGTGTELFAKEFLRWRDNDPEEIRHIGVSTGWGSNGTWVFGAGKYVYTSYTLCIFYRKRWVGGGGCVCGCVDEGQTGVHQTEMVLGIIHSKWCCHLLGLYRVCTTDYVIATSYGTRHHSVLCLQTFMEICQKKL